jgi:hypothetical protein
MARTLRSDQWLFWARSRWCTELRDGGQRVAPEASTRFAKSGRYAKVGVPCPAGWSRCSSPLPLDYHRLRQPAVIWSLLGLAVVGLLRRVPLQRSSTADSRWIAGWELHPAAVRDCEACRDYLRRRGTRAAQCTGSMTSPIPCCRSAWSREFSRARRVRARPRDRNSDRGLPSAP